MRTTKEMQIAVVLRIADNIRNDEPKFKGIYYIVENYGMTAEDNINCGKALDFRQYEYIIRDNTTYVNGKQIAIPLTKEKLRLLPEGHLVFVAANNEQFCTQMFAAEAVSVGEHFAYGDRVDAVDTGFQLYNEIKLK